MNRIRSIACVMAFLAMPAFAAPATEASVRKLLEVSQARKLVESMGPQIEAMMKKSVTDALQGATPSREQQQVIDRFTRRMSALVIETISFEKMEPIYIRLYVNNFTEEEILEILSFYETPAGRALIEKMPVVMQQAMAEMQVYVRDLMPKFQEIGEDFQRELKAASK